MKRKMEALERAVRSALEAVKGRATQAVEVRNREKLKSLREEIERTKKEWEGEGGWTWYEMEEHTKSLRELRKRVSALNAVEGSGVEFDSQEVREALLAAVSVNGVMMGAKKMQASAGGVEAVVRAEGVGEEDEEERLRKMHCEGEEKLWKLKQYRDAEVILGSAAVERRRLLGPKHKDALESGFEHAVALTFVGRHKEADQEYSEVVAGFNEVFGESHKKTISAKYNHALTLESLKRYREAAEAMAVVVEDLKWESGEGDPWTLEAVQKLKTLRAKAKDCLIF